ncbi:hypothetical protein FF38_04408 [Lucilia cuprina]|uniref:CMP/dCMP-type deaminase domain-containing protein n=1 Tax=Lucilia cuprina TaxID=7375 RepID=A0A0L0BWG7_LUCCU|nr:hypothetical protein FF38_04408 [Lucilia cuprina]
MHVQIPNPTRKPNEAAIPLNCWEITDLTKYSNDDSLRLASMLFDDKLGMQIAYEEAVQGYNEGGIPIGGALISEDGKVLDSCPYILQRHLGLGRTRHLRY